MRNSCGPWKLGKSTAAQKNLEFKNVSPDWQQLRISH